MSGTVLNTTGLKMTFDDEFNVFTASANGSVGWMTSLPFEGPAGRTLANNDEAEYYGDSTTGINPFSLQNGVLDITATVAPAGSNPDNLPYNSGAINSLYSATQIYGVYEIRCEMPAGAGLWPAFWLEPANSDGQAELDIFEVLENATSVIYESTHGTTATGANAGQAVEYGGVNTATGFHTYAVDWEPTTVTFYIDGKEVNSVPTPASMDTPMDMIVNLAVGGTGSWPGTPTSAAEFPATMQVDWIRTYASANTIDIAGDAVITQGNGTASVTGQVLYANNGAAATPVAGYDVTLVNPSTGDVVANAITNSAGTYDFTGLAAGTYEIQYLPPPSETVALNGPANFNTDLTPSFTLATGQSYSATTQTLINTPSTIQGQVLQATTWGAVPLAGVVVTLLNASGGALATATTDTSGNYVFADLYSGSYEVEYAPPNAGLAAAGGPTNTATYVTGLFTLAAGQVLTMATESIVPVGASLAGQVQLSPGGSGGIGLGGVIVELLNSAGAVMLSTTTNAAGNYLFTGLGAGTYTAQIAPPSGDVLELGGAANQATGQTAAVTLAANQALTLPTEQLLSQPAGITASVLYEGTGNWPQIGETVELLSSTGSVLATGVTNTAGAFTFAGLAAGTYALDYISPAGTKIVSGPTGMNTTTGVTSAISVAAGVNVTEMYEYLSPVSAAGLVGYVYSKNAAGVSTNLANVTVTLLDASGDTLASQTTSVWGGFGFYLLNAGTYQLRYSTPSGEILQAGSAASAITGLTGPITLAAGQSLTVTPETFVAASPPTATLAGSVTAAGTADAGVTVSLLSGGTPIASEVTGPTGAFAFGGLAAGPYQVQYSNGAGLAFSTGPANSATGVTPIETLTAGQTLTLAPEALIIAPGTLSGAVTYAGAADAGATVTLLSQAGTTVATTTTAANGTFGFSGLSAGTYDVQYSNTATQLYGSGPANTTTGLTGPVSIGAAQTVILQTETLVPVPAAIGGTVTYQGAADPGALVTLIGSAGTTLASTTTGTDGTFAFSGLAPSVYEIQYSDAVGQMFGSGPAGSNGLTQAETLTAGETLSLATENLVIATAALSGSVQISTTGSSPSAAAGEDVSLLNAAGTVVATTVSQNNGYFQFSGVTAGTYSVQYSSPSGATAELGGAANPATGQTAPISLAAGQSVALATQQLLSTPASITASVDYKGTANWAQVGETVELLNSTGSVLATGVTNSAGTVSFGGLVAGSYKLDYISPTGDIIASGPSGINTTTGVTSAFSVAAGAKVTESTEYLSPASNSNLIAYVYSANAAGVSTAVANATVTLLDAAGDTLATETANAWGGVNFYWLNAGTYQLRYSDPSGETLQAGSAANATTNLTSPITLAAGQALTVAPETFVAATSVLSGSVQTSSGGTATALAGVNVALLNASGTVVASTTTGSTGSFQFTALAGGSYQVQYTAPSGQSMALGGLANPATGLTSAISLGSGQTVALAAEQMLSLPGSISGVVQHDGSGDPGTGQSGVTVSLLNVAGTTIGTTTTNGAGSYSFANLATGSYQLLYATPSGEAILAGFAADPTTGLSSMVTLGAGASLAIGTVELGSTTNTFTLTGSGATAVRGAGNYVVTGNASSSSLTLGAGNQSISLTGGNDTITTGAGNSTISALSGGNVITAGGGMNFITVDAKSGNVLDLNNGAQGVTSISGFNTAGDVLDLKATVSGLSIAANLSNLGSYVTATVSSGSTTLSVNPTPGAGTSVNFAVLNGVSTSIAQLIAAKNISLA